jgi:hypothetical protein
MVSLSETRPVREKWIIPEEARAIINVPTKHPAREINSGFFWLVVFSAR